MECAINIIGNINIKSKILDTEIVGLSLGLALALLKRRNSKRGDLISTSLMPMSQSEFLCISIVIFC